jgi:hypothetical protein
MATDLSAVAVARRGVWGWGVDCQARVMVGEERVARWVRVGGGGGGEGVACGVVEVILDGGCAGGVGRLEGRSGERDKKGEDYNVRFRI